MSQCNSGSTDPFRDLLQSIDDIIDDYFAVVHEDNDPVHNMSGLFAWRAKVRKGLKDRRKDSSVTSSTSSQSHTSPNIVKQVVDGNQYVTNNQDDGSSVGNSVDVVMEELDQSIKRDEERGNTFMAVFDDEVFVDENGTTEPVNLPIVSEPEMKEESPAKQPKVEEPDYTEVMKKWRKDRLDLQRAVIQFEGIDALEEHVKDAYSESGDIDPLKKRFYDIVQWSTKQRRRFKAGNLAADQIAELEELCKRDLWSWEVGDKTKKRVPLKQRMIEEGDSTGQMLERISSDTPKPSRASLASSPQMGQAAAQKKAAAVAKKEAAVVKKARKAATKMRSNKAHDEEWNKYYNLVKKHCPLNVNGEEWDLPADYVVEVKGDKIQLGVWLSVQKMEMGNYAEESPNWYNKLGLLFEKGWRMTRSESPAVSKAEPISEDSDLESDEEPPAKLTHSTASPPTASLPSTRLPTNHHITAHDSPAANSASFVPVRTTATASSHKPSTPSSADAKTGIKRKQPSPAPEANHKIARSDSTHSPHQIKIEPSTSDTVRKMQAIDLSHSSTENSDGSSVSSTSSSSSSSSSVQTADSKDPAVGSSFSLKDKKLFKGKAFAAPGSLATQPPAQNTKLANSNAIMPPRVPILPSPLSSVSAVPPPVMSQCAAPLSSPPRAQSAPAKPRRPASPKVHVPHKHDISRDPRLKANSHSQHSHHSAPQDHASGAKSASPSAKSAGVVTHSSQANSRPEHVLLAPAQPAVQSPVASPVPSPRLRGPLVADGNYVALVYSSSTSFEDARFALAKQIDSIPGTDPQNVRVLRLLPEDPRNLFHSRYKYVHNEAKVVNTQADDLLIQGLQFHVDIPGGEFPLKLTDQSRNDLIVLCESVDVHEICYESE